MLHPWYLLKCRYLFRFKVNCIACLYCCLNTEEIYPLIKCHLKLGKIVIIEIRITYTILLQKHANITKGARSTARSQRPNLPTDVPVWINNHVNIAHADKKVQDKYLEFPIGHDP